MHHVTRGGVSWGRQLGASAFGASAWGVSWGGDYRRGSRTDGLGVWLQVVGGCGVCIPRGQW